MIPYTGQRSGPQGRTTARPHGRNRRPGRAEEGVITSFDSDFETAFGEASGATFGEPMDYAGPGGAPVVLAVPVILDDTTEPLDAGSGFGAMRAPRRTGTAFRKPFLAAGVEPVKGGTFTRSSGEVLTLSEAPTGPDSVGQYSFDFGGS